MNVRLAIYNHLKDSLVNAFFTLECGIIKWCALFLSTLKDEVVAKIEDRIAAWTFLPPGILSSPAFFFAVCGFNNRVWF